MNKFRAKPRKEQSQMSLRLGLGKEIKAKFDGDGVCSDGGLLLLRKADDRLELSELAGLALRDQRTGQVKHKNTDLLRQRIYAIAAGYEDCNDASQLRTDAMHQLALGFNPAGGHALASQPTLSRFENSVDDVALECLQTLLVHVFVRSHKRPPKVVRLSMDTTHDEVHGYQQLSFYNGFYETDCFTPLFIFAGDGFPLCAKLRAGNAAPADDAVRMLRKVVHNLRLAWAGVRIELTADAGFAVPELYEFCESNGVTYFIGTRSHNGLSYHAEDLVQDCRARFQELGYEPEPLKKYGVLQDPKSRQRSWRQRQERIRYSAKTEGRMQEHFEEDWTVRRFCEFKYASREWSCERRHIARCEYTQEGPDIRYIVTNARGSYPRRLYEEKYCQRARCELWIKELKNYLKCDRTSCQEFKANQFRLLMHTFAFVLILQLRKASGLTNANVETIRLRLLKIGVIVRERSNHVLLSLAAHAASRLYFERAWNFL